ncbi:MAG: fasciclin domain-containing protein [Acidimicrobiia bacterium]
MKKRTTFLSMIAVLALVLAACSDSGEEATTTEAEAPATTVAETTGTTEEMMDETVVDIAAGNEDFSTLVAAVEAAGLTEALSDPTATLTVFAPTNEAFEAALAALDLTAEELLADTETLTAILTYHVIGDEVTSGDLAAAGTEEITVTTLSGEDLTVIVGDDGSVSFKDQTAVVVTADLVASNGVIHVIDAVLLPPSMTS